jgi:MFS transporter
VASLLLVDFADEWCTFLPAASIDAIRVDLDLSLTQAAAVLVLLPAGGIVGNVCTLAADFVSRRALAGFGALGYGAAMIAFGSGRSFIVLAVSAFVWGAASDAFVHGSQLALADLAGDDLEPTLARTNLLASLGAVVAPVCVAVAETAGLGWRPLLISGGVAMLGYAAWIGAQPLPVPARSADAPAPWAGVRAVLADCWVRRLSVINATENVLDYSFLGFFTLFLVDERRFSVAGAAAMVAVALAGAALGFLVLAVAAPALDARRVFQATSTARVVGIAVLVFVAQPVAIAFTAFALGLVGAAHWVALQAAMLRARPGQTGTTYAVIATLSLPALAVPPLIGAAADRFGAVAGLALYALVPVVVLALLRTRRLGPWSLSFSRRSSDTSRARSRRRES